VKERLIMTASRHIDLSSNDNFLFHHKPRRIFNKRKMNDILTRKSKNDECDLD
jgi:hypothetical protein